MKITSVKYFKLSWLVPIVTTILAIAVEELLNHIGIELPHLLSGGLGTAVLGLMFFYIPYGAMVIALLIFLQNKSKKTHIVTILLSPLLMAALVSIFLLVVGGSGNKTYGIMMFDRFALIVGYSYVALIFILFNILRRCRVVED